ncbi:uncharacterized protein MELLADRAFT_109765 [Melampsora larici-populina 98AG31]|uniref:Uncharacterized protein n=1 Tax=Melampsora larici-populina (strain 98AG31 / pathotype 3-4-7) TaxID=747676 RepID=F4RXJ0_MELLP|nr:uncharacterized protein MELLADRAFT_109765 [Melampsora larici-populina 98AG31]EGG02977.1 hypothetical protein MELLADRAFT_109765 [Melampsora larici-populina 98AG31]
MYQLAVQQRIFAAFFDHPLWLLLSDDKDEMWKMFIETMDKHLGKDKIPNRFWRDPTTTTIPAVKSQSSELAQPAAPQATTPAGKYQGIQLPPPPTLQATTPSQPSIPQPDTIGASTTHHPLAKSPLDQAIIRPDPAAELIQDNVQPANTTDSTTTVLPLAPALPTPCVSVSVNPSLDGPQDNQGSTGTHSGNPDLTTTLLTTPTKPGVPPVPSCSEEPSVLINPPGGIPDGGVPIPVDADFRQVSHKPSIWAVSDPAAFELTKATIDKKAGIWWKMCPSKRNPDQSNSNVTATWILLNII